MMFRFLLKQTLPTMPWLQLHRKTDGLWLCMSCSLTACEKLYPEVEKEATSIIEAVRHWSHFSKGRRFTLVTDEETVSLMFDQSNRGKIKKTPRFVIWNLNWVTWLTTFATNLAAKRSRLIRPPVLVFCPLSLTSLQNFHQSLGHPGYACRLWHFVRQRNLPHSCEEMRKVCQIYRTCAEVKPSFFKPPS